jgi:tellurite methyltransferase
MQREIVRFRQDDVGDWVAELGCHHRQHVRHRPPLLPRPWVETATGRTQRIGTTLDCPLCDRAELPAGLAVVRTVGPFNESTLPAGLRRNHRIASGTWGMLRVLEGSAHFTMQTETPTQRDLCAGDRQPIPPDVLHAVALANGSVEVDFLLPQPAHAND